MMEVKTMKETKKPGKKTSEHIEDWKGLAAGAVILLGIAAGLAKMFEKK